jgi:hypothetical protein
MSSEPLAILYRKPNISNTIAKGIGNITTSNTASIVIITTSERSVLFPAFFLPDSPVEVAKAPH